MKASRVNRSGELEVFVRVVDEDSLTGASRACGLSASAISKLISRLERRLGTQLIKRSTRKLQLTSEGQVFYERGRRILAELEEAERFAAAGEVPVGTVRVNTSASFAIHALAPLVAEFVELHPRISLQIVQTDAVVDLLDDGDDIAIRAGPLKSSALVARKVGETAFTVVAAPEYLEQHGEPQTVEELETHIRLGFGYKRSVNGWPFRVDGKARVVQTGDRVQSSDGEGLRQLALAGAGIARLANFTIGRDIAEGSLVPLLQEFNPHDVEHFHAVYVGGGPLPARVRAVIDFLADRVKLKAI